MEATNKEYEIAYRLLDKNGAVIKDEYGNPHFFCIILWKNENHKIHTAYPYYPQYRPGLNIIFNNLGI